MPTLFAHHRAYVDEVKTQSSDRHGWPGLRLALTEEQSNDLLFTRMTSSALTLELTGTARHLTHMDGIAAERSTNIDDICQMPAGVGARFAWDVGEGLQRSIVVEFGDELFATYCPERFDGAMARGHLVPRDYAPAPALAALVRLLAREIDPATERGPLFADMLIRLLAIEVCDTAWTRRTPAAAQGQAPDRRIIRAVDYINANLGENLSLRDVAAASGLSIGALAKLFPRHTGTSPHAYMLGKRIEKACQLLQSSELPIAQVALATGFADQAHLSKVLKRQLGMTPRSLRLAGRSKSTQGDPLLTESAEW